MHLSSAKKDIERKTKNKIHTVYSHEADRRTAVIYTLYVKGGSRHGGRTTQKTKT
jgi:hypothetical protein